MPCFFPVECNCGYSCSCYGTPGHKRTRMQEGTRAHACPKIAAGSSCKCQHYFSVVCMYHCILWCKHYSHLFTQAIHSPDRSRAPQATQAIHSPDRSRAPQAIQAPRWPQAVVVSALLFCCLHVSLYLVVQTLYSHLFSGFKSLW